MSRLKLPSVLVRPVLAAAALCIAACDAQEPRALTAAAAPSKDWFQWRGPNRDGISGETGLKRQWGPEGPPLVWRTKGLGRGMSSLVISGGNLYTMGNRQGQTFLTSRKLEDGAENWATPIGGGDGPNCTPTVDPVAGLVFGLTKDGTLACLKLADGSVVWKKNFEKDFGGKMMSGWGFSESPLVDGDRLICTPGAPDAVLAALDKTSGEVIWKTNGATLPKQGGGAAYSSPVISNGGGMKQYIQLLGKGLVSVAAADGRLLWNYDRIANNTANIPTPIISGNYVFGSTGYNDGGSALLELTRSGDNGVVAKEVYYKPGRELQNHHGGMILVGDYLYMGHGHNNGFPECVEFKTGRSVWERGRGAGSGSAAVAYADGLLFFRYQDHTMALVEATPDKYNLKGSFKIASKNGESWPHPVIQDGKLYLRDQDELLCYDVRD